MYHLMILFLAIVYITVLLIPLGQVRLMSGQQFPKLWHAVKVTVAVT